MKNLLKFNLKFALIVSILTAACLFTACDENDSVKRQDNYAPGGGGTLQPRNSKGEFEKTTTERPVIYPNKK